MNTYDINGKTAIVTGANRGIGKAIVDSLIANGVGKVYAAVRDVATAGPLAAQYPGKVEAIAFDLADQSLINAAALKASDAHIVVNNAGVYTAASILGDNALDALEFQIDRNLFGLVRTVRAFAPVLKANGGGAFVQLNSVVSIKTFANAAAYCASKAAAYAVTQALRSDLREQGTAVYSVHPGPIATDMADAAGMTAIAEPPSLVGDAICAAFKSGQFHVFPDSMAKQIGAAYAGFAETIVEAELMEA